MAGPNLQRIFGSTIAASNRHARPLMKPRQTVVEMFSTFVKFVDDRFGGWVDDRTLRQTMVDRLKPPEAHTSEAYWMLYWYKHWQSQPSGGAAQHLSAYVQESCYWVALRATNAQATVHYSVADCFQLAIAALPKILESYNPTQGAGLKTYAGLCFGNTIRDTLRQQHEADSRTDWGLLRKLSQKRFVESLQMAGLSTDTIARYRLAWTCYKTYSAPRETPATRQLPHPSRAEWEAIADFYNRQRLQLTPTAPKASPEDLEKWLKFSAKQARVYLYPAIASLNASKPTVESGELQDDLPDPREASPLAALITHEELEERQLQRSQLGAVLTAALAQFNPQMQHLLALYCRDGLTQQQIAARLEMKQYTVSRRLSSAKETLLLRLARWSQDRLHISLTSTAVKEMSVVLEEWLQVHYQNPDRLFSEDEP